MWWDFLSQIYRLPMLAVKRVMLNPMGIFIYGILAKWYIIITIAAVVVTYWVFKGLEQAGVLTIIERQVKKGLWDAQSVAQNCVPKILNLADMWNCINHLPEYNPSQDEQNLRQGLESDMQQTILKPVDSGASNQTPQRDNYDESRSQNYNPYTNPQ